MIRHDRHIEADRWEFGLKVALALLGDKEPKEASKIARLLRKELAVSFDHITPTLDYAIARAKALKSASEEEKRTSEEAKIVASWSKTEKKSDAKK